MLWKRPVYVLKRAHIELCWSRSCSRASKGCEVIPLPWALGRSRLEQSLLVGTMQSESCEMAGDGSGGNWISSLVTWKMQPERKEGWIGAAQTEEGAVGSTRGWSLMTREEEGKCGPCAHFG